MGTGAEYPQMRRHRSTMYVDNYHRIFAFSQSDQVQIWYEWINLRYPAGFLRYKSSTCPGFSKLPLSELTNYRRSSKLLLPEPPICPVDEKIEKKNDSDKIEQ